MCEIAASSRTVGVAFILDKMLLCLQYLPPTGRVEQLAQQAGYDVKRVGSIHAQLFQQTVASLVGFVVDSS